MTFFLLMLLLIGFLFTWHFSNQLSSIFLAIVSPIIGILIFVLDLVVLLVLRIPIDLHALWIMLCTEGLFLLLNIVRIRKNLPFSISLFLFDTLTGIVSASVALFFYKNNFSFASNDTFYIIIMARNILETGLTKWNFASPSGMGIFAPLLQIIGLLFQNDYTWFIQPLLSFFFYVLFIYFGFRAAKKYNISPHLTTAILVLIIAVMLSSNIIIIFTSYIHSNFLSGIFLFLGLLTLLSYLEDNKDQWLIFTTLFLIGFGLCRLENSVFVCVLIILLLAEGRIEWNKLLLTFSPFLVFQSIWFYIIYSLHTNITSDQLSPNMLLLAIGGLISVLLMLILVKNRHLKSLISNKVYRFLPHLLGLIFSLLLLFKWDSTTENILTLFENGFILGNWYLFWVFILILSIFVCAYSPKIENQRLYLYLIIIFFMQVIILGALRDPYHLYWTDSANRMLIHIIPIMVFFIIEKLFAWINKSNLITQKEKFVPND